MCPVVYGSPLNRCFANHKLKHSLIASHLPDIIGLVMGPRHRILWHVLSPCWLFVAHNFSLIALSPITFFFFFKQITKFPRAYTWKANLLALLDISKVLIWMLFTHAHITFKFHFHEKIHFSEDHSQSSSKLPVKVLTESAYCFQYITYIFFPINTTPSEMFELTESPWFKQLYRFQYVLPVQLQLLNPVEMCQQLKTSQCLQTLLSWYWMWIRKLCMQICTGS